MSNFKTKNMDNRIVERLCRFYEMPKEVIHAQDGSMAALLGASPGASTAVSIMLDIIDKCLR